MLRKIKERNEKGSTKFIRPLTSKEKTLLIILLALLSFYLLFSFLINPQRESIEELQAKKLELDETIMENNRILRSEKKIKKAWISLNDERDLILEDFFPSLDQAQIVYLLNDLMMPEGIDYINFNFSKASIEKINENEVLKMDISLPFEAGYKGIYEVIRAIENSPKKIIINQISFEKKEDRLSGDMDLRIYSLEGIANTDKNVIHVESTDDNTSNPFDPYKDYKEPDKDEPENRETDEGSTIDSWPGQEDSAAQDSYNQGREKGKDREEEIQDSLIYDFGKGKYEFFSTNPLFKGSISMSDLSKSNTRSINFEYGTYPSDRDISGYIDMATNNILIDQDKRDLGLWLYSSRKSPGKIAMVFRDARERKVNINITDKIDWTNWEFKKISIPKNLNFPIKLEKIMLEFSKEDELYGNFLFDSIIINPGYFYYRVKPGDTIYGISSKFYNTTKYVGEILELNNMGAGDILRVGRELKLRKVN